MAQIVFCSAFESKMHFEKHSRDENVENTWRIFRGWVGESWWGETEREIWFVSNGTFHTVE